MMLVYLFFRNFMKKSFLLIILFTLALPIFGIIDTNDYYDINLIEKNGTFNFESYKRSNHSYLFGGFDTNGYTEILGRMRLNIGPPELIGFYLVSEILFSNSDKRDAGGEFEKTGNTMLFYGEAYIGFKNKWTSVKFGFQNLISSDAIYHRLLLDDYSGPIFALRWSQLLSRYVDMDLIYSFIRPHQGEWSPNLTTLYKKGELYGKSLFVKKFNFRPLPWIRIGLSDSVYFLGENFNIWFMNPFSIYFITLSLNKFYDEKFGSGLNTGASDLKIGLDFQIGFNGWRVYGELLVDDSDAFFLMFKYPIFPNRIGAVLGGEIRGYLFTRYLKPPKAAEFFLKNLYINFEYAITSKYVYSRDHVCNYEYVREEYQKAYDPRNPISQTELDRVQRVGNFLGYMYGNNADSFDIAVGWRNDIDQVKDYGAEYQTDVYYDSFKKKKFVDRLFKLQLHYRHYRLGDERNIIAPYYMNEHYYYDVDPDLDSDGDGIKDNDTSNRDTEFLRVVLEEGNIFDINFYSDIFRITRFVIGIETKFNFHWRTRLPRTSAETTDFVFKWEIASVITWF